MKKDDTYYLSNEIEVNAILLRCSLVLLFVGPLLAILRVIGINGEFNYRECFFFSVAVLLLYGICKYLQRTMRLQGLIKYLIILGMHSGVCYMATKAGILIYISYALMPALSCLYYRKRFTLHITGFSYIIMMLTLMLRAGSEVESVYYSLSKEEWYSVFGFSLTWEYILLTIVLITLVD